jgi:hypothetical protein
MPNRTPNATIRDLIDAAFHWYKWKSPEAWRFDGTHEWSTPDDVPGDIESVTVATDDGVPGYRRECTIDITHESNGDIRCGDVVCASNHLIDEAQRVLLQEPLSALPPFSG